MLLGPIVCENIFQVGSYCPYQGRIMCIQDNLDNIFAYYLMTSTFTVELHWLELEGIVKMCSSIGNSSHQGPVISEREKKRF